jgi:hypothetical protein
MRLLQGGTSRCLSVLIRFERILLLSPQLCCGSLTGALLRSRRFYPQEFIPGRLVDGFHFKSSQLGAEDACQ